MEPTSAQNKFLIPGAIIVAALIIGGAMYWRGKLPETTNGTDGTGEPTVEPLAADDHILGNPNADIIVFEYSDTECPYCKDFHNTMHRIIDEYGAAGKVAWVYRHFPIAQLHSRAAKEAEATECAAELGGNEMFWTYIDRVFAVTPSNDRLDPAELPKIAAGIGLNQAAFESCLDSGKYAQKIEKSVQAAIAAIPREKLGTPYSVMVTKDGQQFPVPGAQQYETLKGVIDTILTGGEAQ